MYRSEPNNLSKKLLLTLLGIYEGLWTSSVVVHKLTFYFTHLFYLSRFDILGTMKRKLRTDIHYPLTNLDLTPYICPIFRKHPKYNLCAVVVSNILKLFNRFLKKL